MNKGVIVNTTFFYKGITNEIISKLYTLYTQWLFVRDRIRTCTGYSSGTTKLVFLRKMKEEVSDHRGGLNQFTSLILHSSYHSTTSALVLSI